LVSGLLGHGLVDPGRDWRQRRCRCATDEPLGVGGVGGVEDPLALAGELFGVAVVDGRTGHQADAGVAVRVVVEVAARPAVRAGVLHAA